MRKSILAFFLSVLLSGVEALSPSTVLRASLLTVTPAFASPAAGATNDEVSFHFPESATFHATLTSDTQIASVVLEYGDKQQTCGDVIAKAFPQFTPGKTVDAEWTWEMRQSGSLPPGAQLWWRWRVTDANGVETVTETKTAIWLDDVHKWQTSPGCCQRFAIQ
jgi:hypothetical protein